MIIPILIFAGIVSPITYYYYNKNSYNLINKDGIYDIIEINRYLCDYYNKLLIKTLISEMNKKIEIYYRSATEADINFLSLSINEKNNILLESKPELSLNPSYYICENMEDIIKTIEEYTEKFVERKSRYMFNPQDKQKFINKINSSFKKCYAKSNDWKSISIYNNKNDLLATITIDNKLKNIKVKHQTNYITLLFKDNIESMASSVIYYLSFTLANSIIN
jgi:hypothetical protein